MKNKGLEGRGGNRRRGGALLALAAAAVGALFTTSEHVRARGHDYIEHGIQMERHRAVLTGEAGNPWQYRVLAPCLVETWRGLIRQLPLPRPDLVAFVSFRLLQDFAILLCAFAYYRQLGFASSLAYLGMALLLWGMSYSHYDSDLQFNLFFDVLFYLSAALCVGKGRWYLVLPLAVLAASNRETGVLLPFLALLPTRAGEDWRQRVRSRAGLVAASLLLFGGISLYLRSAFPGQRLIVPYGHAPGAPLLRYNLLRRETWRQLFATMNFTPFFAAAAWRQWPPFLRGAFVVLIPPWVTVHAVAAVMAESRLFLVPMALVVIPGALCLFAPGPPPDPQAGKGQQPLP